VGTPNGNTTSDRKIGTAADDETRNFIETHNVTKVARKAVPGSGEESADLLEAEQTEKPDSAGKRGA
jgi:hypothetical protein